MLKSLKEKVLSLFNQQNIQTLEGCHSFVCVLGSSVVLNCGATGNPRPSIVWNKRNRDMAGLEHTIRHICHEIEELKDKRRFNPTLHRGWDTMYPPLQL